jgi:GNAT superfamily N-acetyltransferase
MEIGVRSSSTSLRIEEIVAVHLEAFPGFFMTQLGPQFLRRYYQVVAEYEGGLLLTEPVVDRCMGFVAGFVNPAMFYRELRRRRVGLGLAALSGVLRHPTRLGTLFANYRRAGGAAIGTTGEDTAELSSLAVRPAGAGQGVGSRLVRKFIATAQGRGARRVLLTTDARGNDDVNRFYQTLGFSCVRTFEARHGRWLNEYALEIGKD